MIVQNTINDCGICRACWFLGIGRTKATAVKKGKKA